jgi:DNA-binding transcriptional ArsR family regulator
MTHSLDQTFIALSDPTRRGVVELLRKHPRRASDLANVLGASKPAMSRHLRVLRASGLVDTSSEGDARERIYRLRPDPFKQLRHWLELVEQFWTIQLEAFKEHVERKPKR